MRVAAVKDIFFTIQQHLFRRSHCKRCAVVAKNQSRSNWYTHFLEIEVGATSSVFIGGANFLWCYCWSRQLLNLTCDLFCV